MSHDGKGVEYRGLTEPQPAIEVLELGIAAREDRSMACEVRVSATRGL